MASRKKVAAAPAPPADPTRGFRIRIVVEEMQGSAWVGVDQWPLAWGDAALMVVVNDRLKNLSFGEDVEERAKKLRGASTPKWASILWAQRRGATGG